MLVKRSVVLNTPASKTVEIRIEDLGRHYANPAQVLTEAGLNGPRLNEVLATRLQTSCPRCGIQISSGELEQMAVLGEATEFAHAKLNRLRLGYCAREGCESAVYSIHLDDCPGLDWEMTLKKVDELVAEAQAKAQQNQRREESRRQRQRMLRIVAGVGIVMILYLLQFIWSHGHLPFVKKTHKYKMDPGSMPRLPSR